MTSSGLLLHGIEVNGKVHFDFTVRLPVIRDTINALSDTHERYGTTEGAAAATFYRVAVIANALTALGDVDEGAITADLLLDELTDDDFDLIDTQISVIKKKRMDLNPNSSVTDSPSLPSVSVGSANNK
ncbi:hypothetical protein QVN83_01130 [Yersinia frederiksenii]|uniref:hypothetical protein n=1 Tax=Yersinia frederiksenii TaxID=29484 RepID=UPI0025AAB778|nr:hypothetical protein [Yersinia frederiksenii]MDN0117584.1 hypothetical protein [Yersinia frederiksenii]